MKEIETYTIGWYSALALLQSCLSPVSRALRQLIVDRIAPLKLVDFSCRRPRTVSSSLWIR